MVDGCFSRWFGSGTFLRAKLRTGGSVTAVAKAGPAGLQESRELGPGAALVRAAVASPQEDRWAHGGRRVDG